jgi:hypothetical protein
MNHHVLWSNPCLVDLQPNNGNLVEQQHNTTDKYGKEGSSAYGVSSLLSLGRRSGPTQSRLRAAKTWLWLDFPTADKSNSNESADSPRQQSDGSQNSIVLKIRGVKMCRPFLTQQSLLLERKLDYCFSSRLLQVCDCMEISLVLILPHMPWSPHHLDKSMQLLRCFILSSLCSQALVWLYWREEIG